MGRKHSFGMFRIVIDSGEHSTFFRGDCGIILNPNPNIATLNLCLVVVALSLAALVPE